MKYTFIFPCDEFNRKLPDSEYSEEYSVASSLGFDCILLDHTRLTQSDIVLFLFHANDDANKIFSVDSIFIYRGWMLKVEQYTRLYNYLINIGNVRNVSLTMLNTPAQYEVCHHFDESYEHLYDKVTVNKIKKYVHVDEMNIRDVKKDFPTSFLMKDNVKSVKSKEFPGVINSDISNEDFLRLLERFIDLRGTLYTGNIILKEYYPLKKYFNPRSDNSYITNEWRVFYLNNQVLSMEPNSNQYSISDTTSSPKEAIYNDAIINLPSKFYTVDFAELEDGTWIVIETGDGQVSGLSPNQSIVNFYQRIKDILS